ncbi:MAG TPA: site-specific integrase [Rhodocyclaceae bacterium]|nr:site-specific integrase [Rhodocyclaceae bacterium]
MTAAAMTLITHDNLQLTLPKWGDREAGEVAVRTLPEAISSYVVAALADNSRRAYTGDLQDFLAWGGAVPCTPEVLAEYIAARAQTHSPITITRRVVGISRAHTSQGLPDPAKSDLVRVVLRGIRRTHGQPQRQVTPLMKSDLLSILPLMTGTTGLRDRALILLGFAGAFRRSELVALDVADLQFVQEGLIAHVRKSKTDQDGNGRKVGIPYGRTHACPVKAVREWLDHAGITEGPVFRSVRKGGAIGNRLTAQSVALVVKAYAQAAGLPASAYSGHSLRSGLATSAAQAGITAHKIQQQTGHRSLAMLHRYIRDGQLFVENAGGIL